MTWIPRLSPRSPDLPPELREPLATQAEGIKTLRVEIEIGDLLYGVRDSTTTYLSDREAGHAVWTGRTVRRRIEGVTVGGVSYRRSHRHEQAATGKPWVAFVPTCKGTGDKGLLVAAALRAGVPAAPRRTVRHQGEPAHRYSIDAAELSAVDLPLAAGFAEYLAEHRVQGAYFHLTVHAEDGRLLALGMTERAMTTCTKPSLYCRSRQVLSDFGIAVERPAVPADEDVHWFRPRAETAGA